MIIVVFVYVWVFWGGMSKTNDHTEEEIKNPRQRKNSYSEPDTE